MKYGRHYQTPKNNNSSANTNPLLKDYFIYFLVEVLSVGALFSLEEVKLCPSRLPIQLIRFLLSPHFKSLFKIHKAILQKRLHTHPLVHSFL